MPQENHLIPQSHLLIILWDADHYWKRGRNDKAMQISGEKTIN
jgi:hypothetical protein